MLSATSLIFDARIQKEAKTLRDAGYKVSIIFIDDQVSVSHLKNPKEVWQNYLNSMKDIDNVRIFLASRTWVFLPRFLRMFCQSIEFFIKFTYHTLRQKADIYHCNDLFPALFSWFP